MAQPLKDLYTHEYVSKLAHALQLVYPKFQHAAFVQAVFNPEWKHKELKARLRHITHCLHQFLPLPYNKQLEILKKVAPPFSGFLALFFPDFVEVYGLNEPDLSINALAFFTQYSSSEFAVRPFLVKYEKRMLKQHAKWAKDSNHHIRRLASEGMRPRLPWAVALPMFKKNPTPLIPILEQLKQDPSEYVRKSVANCLNDISKDHPELVIALVNKWKGTSPETDWIVKHASRGLLKQGHIQALAAFNLNHKAKARIEQFKLSHKQIALGQNINFGFTLVNDEKKQTALRIEYKIYFIKANGKPSGKIFQIGTYNLKGGEQLLIQRKHTFVNLTTRKHYAGLHRIAIILNGKELAEAECILNIAN